MSTSHVYFDHSPIERKNLIRPLQEISNFTIEELPLFLSGDRDTHQAFQQRLQNLDTLITPEKVSQFEDLTGIYAKVACLDLSLLMHCCGHLQENLPVKIYILLYHMAGKLGRLPTFLYEDAIFYNPIIEDPRLFTLGYIGTTERDFLLIHLEIEKRLEEVIKYLLPLLDKNQTPYLDDDHLEGVQEHIHTLLGETTSYFLAMKKMPLGDFKAFRDYYGAAPNSKHFGVSGRFSETMQTLRIITEGKRILHVIPDYFDELLENFQYYPIHQRIRMVKLISNTVYPSEYRETHYESLIELLSIKPSKWIEEVILTIRNFSDKVVNIHYGITNKYVIRHP